MTISTEPFVFVNTGTSANDGTGDSLRAAFVKVNENFANIENVGFDAANIFVTGTVQSSNLLVSAGVVLGNTAAIAFPDAIINAVTNANSYSQFNIQNVNSGTRASSDLIATTSDGTDSFGYIDLGINGNNYSSTSWTISGARDGYVYINGGNLTLGTDTANKNVKIHVGGTFANNVVTTFNAANVTMAANLILANTGAPLTAGSSGTVGQVAFDSGNIYICVAPNTWKSAALASF